MGKITRIKFEGVVKEYSRHKRAYGSFKNFILEFTKGRKDKLRALKKVSFRISDGENVGIIGANGSGKSTALKLLARISVPTSGSIEVNGKVAALIQVGAGFHPELTGLENIYLNGAIMGLSKKQIREKLEDIIDFSELREFMQTPVKYYSSGMYMRLGFAIAVHVEADILLIDEVLAVGDLSFQRKSLDRMNYLKNQGKTIIFVSHNIHQVESLCERVIWLHEGKLMMDGPSKKIINEYVKVANKKSAAIKAKDTRLAQTGTGEVYINSVNFTDVKGRKIRELEKGRDIKINFKVTAKKELKHINFHISLVNDEGINVGGDIKPFERMNKGVNEVGVKIGTKQLLPGAYYLRAGIYNERMEYATPYCYAINAGSFIINSAENLETNRQLFGLVRLFADWYQK